MESGYLGSIKKQFEFYKMLGDKTIAQLDDHHLFLQINDETNSIAIIIKHLWGNMLSRWTDLLTSDGEKEWRDRDAEFENDIQDRKELSHKWDEAWNCLFSNFNQITESDLSHTVYIRNQGHTVLEAINRQLSHIAYHIGQIVFLGKLFCNSDWKSLSIPRGKSKEFNLEKFSKPKQNQHFTEEFLANKPGENTISNP